MEQVYRLTMSCPDQVGIVAKISQFIAQYNGSILEANHHTDTQSQWFFMRHEITASSIPFGLETFKEAFSPIANSLQMQWNISDSNQKPRVILMCSKESHCIADILNRWHSGDLDCDIPCVISNHPDLKDLVGWYGIPFYHVPISEDKGEHFTKVSEIIAMHKAQTIVLARYMQILPPTVCQQYQHKIINIHHSFLPSFAGAKPYHQAYERGVKLIGATCHYVTEDLDEGPIIEQDVARINNRMQAHDMVRLGKDVEKLVLARGLQMHLEDRVIVHHNKTVILD
ncbi:formyltetrahydrofolate deformylase [Psychrobium sp. 1_MG-2023]|uniref:formyltetrahydrofolate deformylase n=1 Tax=Psychrobium sp. 1_MG-2023 TaxID=3062624 RepID=UPI000C34F51E|nr:formyltetrahydrofolate deformylase [Psychrobium sp. 1_MG-2023]MDP2560214.1 formyltetrahydrofolate deformylase [Psychrobium sp. 1_MG-2023]PKF57025.1 formyltetrahydrofolate deformylase [Alteromonadales bacterium alter-6D02]